MAGDQTPLTQSEREELEQLRAERRAREQVSEQERARIARARARGRELMEPGEDLSMPLGQKVVLVGLAVLVAVIVALFVLMPR